MKKEIVINSNLSSFFIWEGNNVLWMYSTSVRKLFIDKDKKFRAIMATKYLDEIGFIDGLEGGFSIVIRNIECGPLGDIKGGYEFIELRNCQIKKKWFDNLTLFNLDEREVVSYYWYISGDYIVKYKMNKV